VAAWGCSVVGIGFVSSIWLMGLIVEEDPVNRMPFTLSKERILPEIHRVEDGVLTFGPVVTGKRQPSAALPAYPETSHLLRIPDQDHQFRWR
jgi:hypothetical protein